MLAILGMGIETNVSRGENRGRVLQHNFVSLEHVERPLENGGVEFDLPAINKGTAKRFALAAWVVEKGDSKPSIVLGGWLPEEHLAFK